MNRLPKPIAIITLVLVLLLIIISVGKAQHSPSDPSADPDAKPLLKQSPVSEPPGDPSGDPDLPGSTPAILEKELVCDSVHIEKQAGKTFMILYYKRKRIAVYRKEEKAKVTKGGWYSFY